MKLLLDTHILLWALSDDPALPATARKMIINPENEIYYSIISPWEVEIKHLSHPEQMSIDAEKLTIYCREAGFFRLPVYEQHIMNLQKLQRPENAPVHKDPFDRIMICQAMEESMLFVTHDKLLGDYHEPCIYMV
ncbi:MAG: type II toxin-antitoxin system VapC family toxin [Anaerolineaceae bacterium]|nr:type II toxin-antitoxin system VapC family toxin [Oscillospiraceae bacterium]MBQ6479795.1 type II toxin-antitoxin system VapC family toxin [Anaerolineaceae bacterium]